MKWTLLVLLFFSYVTDASIATRMRKALTLADTIPNAFDFTDQTGVTVSTLTTSNILQITGITTGTNISISGGGSPQYRVCSTSNCSAEVQTWGSTPGTGIVLNNHYVQVRLTSSSQGNAVQSATLTVGGTNDTWNVTTVPGAIITNVTSSTANGYYAATSSISIQVTFDVAVNVVGNPRLLLETGTTDRYATYSSGSGSTSLTFSYTVQAGDTSNDLDYVATTSLELNGGTIRNLSSLDASLTLAAPAAAGALGANKAIVIDTTGPSLATSLALVSPASSPSNVTTPTIRVNGVSTGDTVKIYTDGSCTVPGLRGSGSSVGSYLDIVSNTLSGDTTYTYKAEVLDQAGNSSGCSTATVSYVLDTTVPVLTGSVADGTTYASLTSSPTLTWTAGTDTGGSGISYYELAIGTTSGGTQTLNWTNIGNVTSYQRTGLTLLDSTLYYPSVRAVDVAGNISTAINGDGWTALSGPNTNAIIISELTIESVSTVGFSARITYVDDLNLNGTATLWYCNNTDSSGCNPLAGTSAIMGRSGDKFRVDVSGLSTPNDPGDTLNIQVVAADTDGVTGSPLTTTVTLPALHRYWRILGTGISATRWQVNEIEMRTASGTADLTSTAFGIASDTAGGSALADAFDNGVSTFWKSNTGLPHWVGQDFGVGNSKWIGEVTIKVEAAVDEGLVTVQYSDDNVNWVSVYDLFATVGGSVGSDATAPAWVSTSTTAAPSVRVWGSAIYTGSKMVVWGGTNGTSRLDTGGVFDPVSNSWTATNMTGAPAAREFHASVWTGTHMIVWGGNNGGTYYNDGFKYDPTANTWSTITVSGAPVARRYHRAVWTGTEMIVWGGADSGGGVLNSGGKYNSIANSWSATSLGAGVPTARSWFTITWTGSQMIIWGGNDGLTFYNTGSRYDPVGDAWSAMTTTGALSARSRASGVWSSTEMIVWGGINGATYYNTGSRYNPTSNVWTAMSVTGAPTGRIDFSAIWSGSEMLVWGGVGGAGATYYDTGGRYSPGANVWEATPLANVPSARSWAVSVWADDRLIVWGGYNQGTHHNTGGMLKGIPQGSWSATQTTGAPTARTGHTTVWTGSLAVVWGGSNGGTTYYNSGGKYDPVANSWTATSTTGAPSVRQGHVAAYVSGKMSVWGGNDGTYLANGGRYDPTANTWQTMSTTNAPPGIFRSAAIAAGSEMIVWGGWISFGNNTNGGSRYNPTTDVWTLTTTSGAPPAKNYPILVWSGTKMLVWGSDNTGGVYDPGANSWTTITTTNAPTIRWLGSGVWTGSEMIVWGGGDAGIYTNTGGRYKLATDTWTRTSNVNAPSARNAHGAIWTGSKMVVWGGTGPTFTPIFNTGGVYDPTTDVWTPTTLLGAPSARSPGGKNVILWTGSKVLVWGGYDVIAGSPFNTGGLFTP